MTTPHLVLGFALLTLQAALLTAGIYLLIKAGRHARVARHHPTPTAYWQHRAHAAETRNKAFLLIAASFATARIATTLTTD